jgi:hypothetical protein
VIVADEEKWNEEKMTALTAFSSLLPSRKTSIPLIHVTQRSPAFPETVKSQVTPDSFV